MPLRLMEGLQNDLLEYFEQRLPDKLAELSTEYNDSVELTLPHAYINYEPDPLTPSDGWPLLFVLVPSVPIDAWSPAYIRERYEVLIGIICIDQDAGNLSRKRSRYMRAILELLIESQLEAQLPWSMLESMTIDNSPTFANNSEFLTDAQLSLTMRSRAISMLGGN